MPARFREVFFYAGVDERTVAGNVGIIVPLKGSNVVMLDDGLALSTVSPVASGVTIWPYLFLLNRLFDVTPRRLNWSTIS